MAPVYDSMNLLYTVTKVSVGASEAYGKACLGLMIAWGINYLWVCRPLRLTSQVYASCRAKQPIRARAEEKLRVRRSVLVVRDILRHGSSLMLAGYIGRCALRF